MEEVSMHLSPAIAVRQRGVLDSYTIEEVKSVFAAEPGGRRLAARFSNMEMLEFSEEKVMPLLQETIDSECDKGASLICILCTNKLGSIRSRVPVIEPYELMHNIVAAIGNGCKAGALFPFESFADEMYRNWLGEGFDVSYRCGRMDPCTEDNIRFFREEGVDLLVLDCIGYSWICKKFFSEQLGVPVVHPRSLIVDMIHNLLDIDMAATGGII